MAVVGSEETEHLQDPSSYKVTIGRILPHQVPVEQLLPKQPILQTREEAVTFGTNKKQTL